MKTASSGLVIFLGTILTVGTMLAQQPGRRMSVQQYQQNEDRQSGWRRSPTSAAFPAGRHAEVPPNYGLRFGQPLRWVDQTYETRTSRWRNPPSNFAQDDLTNQTPDYYGQESPAYPGEERSRAPVNSEYSRAPETPRGESNRSAAMQHFSDGYYAGYADGYSHGAQHGSLYMLTPQSSTPRRPFPVDLENGFQRQYGYRAFQQDRGNSSINGAIRGQLRQQMRDAYGEDIHFARDHRFVTGTVVRSIYASLAFSDMNHVIALIQTDDGDQVVADLGSSMQLGAIDLERGDRIAIVGRTVSLNSGDELIRARRVQADGQIVDIQYAPPPEPSRLTRERTPTWAHDALGDRRYVAVRGAAAFVATPRTSNVIAYDFGFQPETLTVLPGEAVQIRLINRGNTRHSIVFELPEGEVGLRQPVEPGMVRTLTFTAPRYQGFYRFYCPIGNHQRLGMEGELIVTTGEAYRSEPLRPREAQPDAAPSPENQSPGQPPPQSP